MPEQIARHASHHGTRHFGVHFGHLLVTGGERSNVATVAGIVRGRAAVCADHRLGHGSTRTVARVVTELAAPVTCDVGTVAYGRKWEKEHHYKQRIKSI